MPAILLPERWRRPPEYPVEIDWGHPLAMGLEFDAQMLGHYAAGMGGKAPLVLAQGTNRPLAAADGNGLACRWSGATVQCWEWASGALLVAAEPWSMVAEYTRTAALAATGTIMAVGRSNSGDYNINFGAVLTSHVAQFRYRTTSDMAGTFINSSGSFAIGIPTQVAMVARTTTNRSLFFDVSEEVNNTASLAAHATTSVTRVRLGITATNSPAQVMPSGLIRNARIYSRELSQDELRELKLNPYQFYKPLVRRVWVPVAGGPSTFTYAGSGTLTLSGAAAATKTKDYAGAGTLTFSGAATTSYTPAGATTYTYAGSGTVTFSGADATTKAKAFPGSGTIALSGAATTTYTPGLVQYAYTGSGGIEFSGAAQTSGPRAQAEQPSGGWEVFARRRGISRRQAERLARETTDIPASVVAKAAPVIDAAVERASQRRAMRAELAAKAERDTLRRELMAVGVAYKQAYTALVAELVALQRDEDEALTLLLLAA